LETVIAGVGSRGELPSPPFLSLSLSLSLLFSPCARPLFFPLARAPALPCPRRRPRPLPCPRRRPHPLPWPRRHGPAPLPARGGDPPAPSPARGAAPAPLLAWRRPRPPARAARPPGAAALPPTQRLDPLRAASRPSAWLAWPRRGLALPPFTLNAFPRAQPHARGDYSWFLVNFKLRSLACYVARFVARRIYLISDSIDVLRRALRRATILCNFRLFNV
jgi:hypothetical protein